MTNVRAISPKGLTPEVVYQNFAKEIPKLRSVYIIGFYDDKNAGLENCSHTMFASGTLNDIGFASLVIQDLALKFLSGEIDQE